MSTPSTMQWLRTAAHRISLGSGRRATYLTTWTLHRARRIWQRATTWLGEGEGIGWLLRLAVLLAGAALLRKIIAALAVALYARVRDGGAPWLLWAAAAWWVVSAYRAGADGWKPRRPAVPQAKAEKPDTPAPEPVQQEEARTPEATEGTVPEPEQPPAEPLRISPVELVATVRDIGTPHAQLKPIAEHLRESTDAVRATAASMRWPVKDVRMQGRSASAGLRWDECPSPPLPDPSPGVVGAGHPADDNDDDAEYGFTTVPDEDNPARTHVIWNKPTTDTQTPPQSP
ncbi:hypothetical protein [Streptomyces sp. NPDC048242]|uniref:hypothetical protein n=1 Tax=Streptomyces sp. NPDC048242 TaxID=3155026 RepID=UPI00341F72F4